MSKANKLNFSWWIIVALIVGIIFSFYHLTIPNLWGVKSYSPLSLNSLSPSVEVDEAIFYATKTREIFDGHFKLSDLMIAEYKQSPSVFLGELVPASLTAALSKLGKGVEFGFMISDFLFPALGFLSLTWFLYWLTKNQSWAMIGALLTMFFYHYAGYLPYLPSILRLIIKALDAGRISFMVRSFHSQITLPLFVIFLTFLYQQKKRLSGVMLGVLAYSHFFYFSFALALLGLRLKKNLKGLVLGLLIALPYLVSLIQFKQSSLSADFFDKIYYSPKIDKNQVIVLVLGLGLTWLVKNKQKRWFFRDIFITGLGLMVGSALLKFGLDDPIGHWMLRAIYPSLIMLIVVILAERIKKINAVITILIIISLLGYQFRTHWQYFKNAALAFYLEPKKKELFNWLNENTPNGSVVVTNSLKDNLYLQIYTHNNSYIPRAQISLAPTAEAEERFLIAQKMAGKTEPDIRAMFVENTLLKQKKRFDFDQCGGVYLYFRKYINKDYYNCFVPEEVLEQILQRYQQIEPELTKYQADYWLTDQDFTKGKLLWENQVYKLFKL